MSATLWGVVVAALLAVVVLLWSTGALRSPTLPDDRKSQVDPLPPYPSGPPSICKGC
jgi:hypothetical protein